MNAPLASPAVVKLIALSAVIVTMALGASTAVHVIVASSVRVVIACCWHLVYTRAVPLSWVFVGTLESEVPVLTSTAVPTLAPAASVQRVVHVGDATLPVFSWSRKSPALASILHSASVVPSTAQPPELDTVPCAPLGTSLT